MIVEVISVISIAFT